jgi:hypothetical protein
MSPIDQLKAVLCDPTGKCCIDGSDEDRAIIDRALQALAQPKPFDWESFWFKQYNHAAAHATFMGEQLKYVVEYNQTLRNEIAKLKEKNNAV